MTDGLLITGDIKEDEESVPRSVEPTDKVSHETKIVITGTETNEEENSVGIDITENKPGTDITENKPGTDTVSYTHLTLPTNREV